MLPLSIIGLEELDISPITYLVFVVTSRIVVMVVMISQRQTLCTLWWMWLGRPVLQPREMQAE